MLQLFYSLFFYKPLPVLEMKPSFFHGFIGLLLVRDVVYNDLNRPPCLNPSIRLSIASSRNKEQYLRQTSEKQTQETQLNSSERTHLASHPAGYEKAIRRPSRSKFTYATKRHEPMRNRIGVYPKRQASACRVPLWERALGVRLTECMDISWNQ